MPRSSSSFIGVALQGRYGVVKASATLTRRQHRSGVKPCSHYSRNVAGADMQALRDKELAREAVSKRTALDSPT